MPAFDYAAYDLSGKQVSGVISADSERHARRLLKEKKLLPSKLSEVSQTKNEKVWVPPSKRESIILICRYCCSNRRF